jgi:hypothetical protein
MRYMIGSLMVFSLVGASLFSTNRVTASGLVILTVNTTPG